MNRIWKSKDVKAVATNTFFKNMCISSYQDRTTYMNSITMSDILGVIVKKTQL